MIVDFKLLPEPKMFKMFELLAFYEGKVKKLQPFTLSILQASTYKQEHSFQHTTRKSDNLLACRNTLRERASRNVHI
jgi:hypothetical protein